VPDGGHHPVGVVRCIVLGYVRWVSRRASATHEVGDVVG